MANYYVSSAAGSGGSGTLVDPWKLGDLLTGIFTPGVALTTLTAGDTLNFRGGTYTITDTADNSGNVHLPYIRPTSSGTALAPITLRTYPGESVTIARTAQSGGGIQRV